MPPAMETVNKMKTVDRKTTIRTVADWRLNRLLEAIFKMTPDFESALNRLPVLSPKYCMGDIAAVGDSLAALRSGFTPNIKPNTKKVTNTIGANQKFGAFW
jgi:hypothetical protein